MASIHDQITANHYDKFCKKVLNVGVNGLPYTDIVSVATTSDIGTANSVYIDQGDEIDMRGYNTLGVYVNFTTNDSTTNTIKILSKHTSGGADEYILASSSDYVKTVGDSDVKICYEFETGGIIPYIQIQSAAGAVGTTAGTLTIDVAKSNK